MRSDLAQYLCLMAFAYQTGEVVESVLETGSISLHRINPPKLGWKLPGILALPLYLQPDFHSG